MSLDMIIFYGVIIFFGLVTIIAGSLFWILWNRRKLIYTRFLNDTGQWEVKTWKPDKIGNTFIYDNETYKFDIKKCTRDKINRPVGQYYKGNPEMMEYDYNQTNKKIVINASEITAKDFSVLMLSKVLRDIFQDDEVINMLWILIIEVAVIGVIGIIITATHNPDVTLASNNQTTAIIEDAVKRAIGIGQ